MLEAGLATHFVAAQNIEKLEDALHSLGPSGRDADAISRAIASVQVGPYTYWNLQPSFASYPGYVSMPPHCLPCLMACTGPRTHS